MRAVTAILLGAVLGVLTLIAYDLHRVARFYGNVNSDIYGTVTETAAQHDARVRRQLRELQHDFTLSLDAPAPTTRPAATPPPK